MNEKDGSFVYDARHMQLCEIEAYVNNGHYLDYPVILQIKSVLVMDKLRKRMEDVNRYASEAKSILHKLATTDLRNDDCNEYQLLDEFEVKINELGRCATYLQKLIAELDDRPRPKGDAR